MLTTEQRYKEWALKAFEYMKSIQDEVGQLAGVESGSTQFKPKLDRRLNVVVLGHDAHEGRDADSPLVIGEGAFERFFTGNKCWNRRHEWRYWASFESALSRVGASAIFGEDFCNALVTNAVLFNFTGKAAELNYELGKIKSHQIVNDCMALTSELVFDIIKPKMLICFSNDLIFLPLKRACGDGFSVDAPGKFSLPGSRKKVMLGTCNGVRVVSIPHPSYGVSYAVADLIKREFDKWGQAPNV